MCRLRCCASTKFKSVQAAFSEQRLLCVACVDSLGDFKYSEQSQGSQHTDAERRPRFNHVPDHLTNASHDHLESRA